MTLDELSEGRRALLGMYQRVRRYAVPRWMIEAAAERRLAGDVAGACAAAGVDLDVDVAEIARACGRETADLVEDDLRHLVPDLLRWHMPRLLIPPRAIWDTTGVLRRYPAGGGANLMVDRVRRDPVRLRVWVRTPRDARDVVDDRGSHLYHLHRSCWDARYTDELRERCGGSDRIPFFHADGRPLAAGELPSGPRPEDPVATVEWLTMLWDQGRAGEALEACGITLAPEEPRIWPVGPWVAVERLVADAREVLEHGVPEADLMTGRRLRGETVWVEGADETQVFPGVELTFGGGGSVTARRGNPPLGNYLVLKIPEYRHPVDFDLLRFGYLTPGDLHPLVAQALFPARAPGADGPPAPPRTAAGGDDEQRQELMDRAYFGDTPGVLALLDAGFDPATCAEDGATLLHLLAHLDHEVLLPRLLAAGLDVNATDADGRTPLHAAAEARWNRRAADDLVDRLIDAGGIDLCSERDVLGCVGAEVTRTPPLSEDVTWRSRPAPDAEQLRRLRAEAERGRYRSLVRLARGLYLAGRGPGEVLAECFDAAFPEELTALAECMPLAGHERRDVDFHALKLAVPPDRGGPIPPRTGALADFDDDKGDQRILAHDPDLVPLLTLTDRLTEYGGLTLCYRLSEPGVFGIDDLDPQAPVRRCGPSLLIVLRRYHAAVIERLEMLAERDPQQLAGHRAALDQVDALLGPVDDTPPAPTPLPVLRARASRGDYESMSRLARALYAAGNGPRDVLAECFGTAYPEEFFVIADAGPYQTLPGTGTNLPWELAVPLERGGPVLRPAMTTWRAERRIHDWDPDLVPLVALYADDRVDHGARKRRPRVPHGDLMLCYRLSELAAGRSTVVGVPWRSAEEGGPLSVRACGDSLLTVLHEYATAVHRLDEWEIVQPWNRGAGSIDDLEVEMSAELVEQIEELRQRVAER
ncbi:ankyrin repeat domain-containing protein [Dactylosporangium sp. CA-233914]|uniref:ankyrin repeat domain-containing protein n=1 Tax=Dactylosporangium sp. CA-233914 TaxID=3239934 RepID=UPI003D9086A9